jgi:tetratricopeptide (TPR) repeat protein
MANHFRILVLTISVWLVGCTQLPCELKLAQELMKTKPDSALHVLQKINPDHYTSESDRALYGLLLFQALDRNNQTLQPNSVLEFSANYYQKKNRKHELAISYYYKARIHKIAQRFDEATVLYIKALDILKNSNDYCFLGKINSDIGDICGIQKDYNVSLPKYQIALNYFQIAKDTLMICHQYIKIGRIYRFKKDYLKAFLYYRKALNQSKDSIIAGTSYQEMGLGFIKSVKLDSAKYYLLTSLRYPYSGTSYAIRCCFLADTYYEINKYDSAIHFAALALNYPISFYTQRDCNRILANSEYYRGDFDKMGIYLQQYQKYADSIRIIESQTKSAILENLHQTTEETKGAKRNMALFGSISLITSLLLGFIAYYFYNRNKLKKEKLHEFKEQLIHKQAFFNQNLLKKMEEIRVSQADKRKNASPDERIRLDKELYERCLHLNNWAAFVYEMNHAFNNIVDVLQLEYPTITQKEITWSCLHLLNIPNPDRMMLLNTTAEGLYKLKQRLAKKLNLKNTKELDSFLHEMAVLKN